MASTGKLIDTEQTLTLSVATDHTRPLQ